MQLQSDPGQPVSKLHWAGHLVKGATEEATAKTAPTAPTDSANRPIRTNRRKYLFIFSSLCVPFRHNSNDSVFMLITLNQRQNLGEVARTQLTNM